MSLRDHTNVGAVGRRLGTAAWSRLPSQPLFRVGFGTGLFLIPVIGVVTVAVALLTWFSGGQLYSTGTLINDILAGKGVRELVGKMPQEEASANSPLGPLVATSESREPLTGEPKKVPKVTSAPAPVPVSQGRTGERAGQALGVNSLPPAVASPGVQPTGTTGDSALPPAADPATPYAEEVQPSAPGETVPSTVAEPSPITSTPESATPEETYTASPTGESSPSEPTTQPAPTEPAPRELAPTETELAPIETELAPIETELAPTRTTEPSTTSPSTSEPPQSSGEPLPKGS